MFRYALSVIPVLLPWQAFGCSVCFTGRGDFLDAFYVTTALLIILPPSILGSIVFFIRKKIKEAQAEQEADLL